MTRDFGQRAGPKLRSERQMLNPTTKTSMKEYDFSEMEEEDGSAPIEVQVR